MSSVSVVMVVQDDLPFLKQAVAAAQLYADEIVIFDNESTDGTKDYLEDLRLQRANWAKGVEIKTGWVSRQVMLENGYAYVKNLAADCATSDWIHSLDADERLQPEQAKTLKSWLGRCRRACVSIRTHTYIPRDWKPTTTDFDEVVALWGNPSGSSDPAVLLDEMRHRRIYRRDAGIRWRGYIHEELYQGEENCAGFSECSDLIHQHFTNFRTWQDVGFKTDRYAWMLMQAYNDPELRKWTNAWWYTVHVPSRLEELKERAARFEKLISRSKA